MIIIDTREPFEYAESHVEGAINIPPMEFMSGSVPRQLAGTPKDTQIIVYCRTGQRSNTCSMMLQTAGFTNLVNGRSEGNVRAMLAAEN